MLHESDIEITYGTPNYETRVVKIEDLFPDRGETVAVEFTPTFPVLGYGRIDINQFPGISEEDEILANRPTRTSLGQECSLFADGKIVIRDGMNVIDRFQAPHEVTQFTQFKGQFPGLVEQMHNPYIELGL